MSLNATQGEDTKSVSDMRIQFKRISIVSSVAVTPGRAGRSVDQWSSVNQNANVGLQNLTYGQSQTAISGMKPTR
jgi:hypothetical protein